LATATFSELLAWSGPGYPPLNTELVMKPIMAELTPIALLDRQQRLEAAQLIYASLPEFYQQFGISTLTLFSSIADQLCKKNNELEHGYALVHGALVIGVYTAYPAEESKIRQIFSMLALQKTLTPEQRKTLHEKMGHSWHHFSQAPAGSYYLSRIAVGKLWRGQGLADQLLNHFSSAATDWKYLSLHVYANNLAALAFYRRHGFVHQDQKGQEIYLLTRDLRHIQTPTSPFPKT